MFSDETCWQVLLDDFESCDAILLQSFKKSNACNVKMWSCGNPTQTHPFWRFLRTVIDQVKGSSPSCRVAEVFGIHTFAGPVTCPLWSGIRHIGVASHASGVEQMMAVWKVGAKDQCSEFHQG